MKKLLLIVIICVSTFSGCVTEGDVRGTNVVLPAQTNFSRYSIAGIIVTNNAWRNELGATVGYDKTGIIISDEKYLILKMLASRFLVENRFNKVYDYEKKQKGVELIIDLTVNKFGYEEQNNLVITGASINAFNTIVHGQWKMQRLGEIGMNVKFYDAAKHTLVAEVNINWDAMQNAPYGEKFEQKNVFKTYSRYIISCAIDELVTFMDLSI